MGDLFQYEKKILKTAMKTIKKEEYEDKELFDKYKSMVLNYKKFLRQMEKLLSISDNHQKLLKETQEKLELEIRERKKAEEMLEQKVIELTETKKQLEEANQKLKNMSFLDGLTQIPNRRRFDEVLNAEWKRALRNNSCLSVLMLDIDFFKEFNDNYGHLTGDDCLKKIAKTLSGYLNRASDFIARYGGEEFVVVLPSTDQEGAIVVAERLKEQVELLNIKHEYSRISNYVTISVGVATVVPDNGLSPEKFVNCADNALYRAKNEGRNRVKSIEVE